MEIIPLLVKELDAEIATTRKMLERVPNDQWGWKPHSKSMTMLQLTTHLAEIPAWPAMALDTSELDFAAMPYQPTHVNNTAELLELLEKSATAGRSRLEQATEDELLPTWTMRMGEKVLMVFTKYEVIRHAIAQMIHHRAQLSVFLRLLNVPIPGTYGPSADEMGF